MKSRNLRSAAYPMSCNSRSVASPTSRVPWHLKCPVIRVPRHLLSPASRVLLFFFIVACPKYYPILLFFFFTRVWALMFHCNTCACYHLCNVERDPLQLTTRHMGSSSQTTSLSTWLLHIGCTLPPWYHLSKMNNNKQRYIRYVHHTLVFVHAGRTGNCHTPTGCAFSNMRLNDHKQF